MDQVITFAESESSWNCLASDGSGYASLAALNAAGKHAFPNFDPGIHPAHIIFANQSSADTATAGAGFFFAINRGAEFSGLASDTLRDAVATPCFSGQTWSYPGNSFISSVTVSNVWVRKTTAGDLLTVTAITG